MTLADVPLLTVDFESRSKVSIKDLGGRIYAQHPTTEVVCASFAWMEDGRISTHAVAPARPGWDVPWPWGDVGVFDALAHNHRFDARVWERLGWPTPRRWVDTTELSRRAGMPLAKLEYLAQELLGESKDMEGNALTKSLSRLVSRGARKGEYSLDPIPADVLARVVEYCIKDSVLALRLYYEHFQPWDHVSDFEDAVLEFDRVVNNRGVGFDVALARALQHVDDRLAADALAAAGLQDPKAVSSNDRFRAGMAAFGVHIDNAQKATVLPLLEHPDERVRLLAAARLGGNTIAGGKLAAALSMVSPDERLRDSYVYAKAHPWRWAGAGPQLQNLPK